jgi:hypothetical protein
MIKEKELVSHQQNQSQISFPELYANAALANISLYEFELTLGLASLNYEGIRPVVIVRMSPSSRRNFRG